MTNILAALCSLVEDRPGWSADWAFGCPLIVVTVIVHVFGLSYLSRRALEIYRGDGRLHRYPHVAEVVVLGSYTLLATILHALETFIWAAAYRGIGAMPNSRSAVLYSLGAMTTYGHPNLFLESRWGLLGALEALDGWLLFGLSTAFLFGMIQEIKPAKRTTDR